MAAMGLSVEDVLQLQKLKQALLDSIDAALLTSRGSVYDAWLHDEFEDVNRSFSKYLAVLRRADANSVKCFLAECNYFSEVLGRADGRAAFEPNPKKFFDTVKSQIDRATPTTATRRKLARKQLLKEKSSHVSSKVAVSVGTKVIVAIVSALSLALAGHMALEHSHVVIPPTPKPPGKSSDMIDVPDETKATSASAPSLGPFFSSYNTYRADGRSDLNLQFQNLPAAAVSAHVEGHSVSRTFKLSDSAITIPAFALKPGVYKISILDNNQNALARLDLPIEYRFPPRVLAIKGDYRFDREGSAVLAKGAQVDLPAVSFAGNPCIFFSCQASSDAVVSFGAPGLARVRLDLNSRKVILDHRQQSGEPIADSPTLNLAGPANEYFLLDDTDSVIFGEVLANRFVIYARFPRTAVSRAASLLKVVGGTLTLKGISCSTVPKAFSNAKWLGQ